jgi:hypothetical protein
MTQMDYNDIRNSSPGIVGQALQLAGRVFTPPEQIDCGEIGPVSGRSLIEAGRRYDDLTNGNCHPQLAALVFDVTGDFRALDFYFPIVNSLKAEAATRQDFYNAVRYIANHPGLDLRVYAENRQDVTNETPPAVRHIVAGHLAEVFFYRRDIIERFFSQPRHFLIYTNRQAFNQDGGLAGGDYNFDRQAIQLEMSRLFEGFSGKTPGVAPFLHELGHMLDHFEAGTGRMGQCEGILPGMASRDGPVFTPQARQLFSAGKQLEQQRYLAFQQGRAGPNDPVPVGHPYVFQTDGEFIAGFLEMFFRNPNYFASQNPQLYQAFAELFRQDPRRYWPEDFSFYVTENRKAYLGGERPHPQNITIPRN